MMLLLLQQWRFSFALQTLIPSPLTGTKLRNETTPLASPSPLSAIQLFKTPDHIRPSAKRSGNRDFLPVKDLRGKKPRDFSRSHVPVTLERPSFHHSFEKLDEEKICLGPDQAVGEVVAAQANFMRVIVRKSGLTSSNVTSTERGAKELEHSMIGTELLCVVRAVLKKIKKVVMVGDKVLVSGIDWIDGRGMVEEVFDRKSETSDPPVANVDQILVLFSLDRPRPEPTSVSRFVLEAESTGIPFSLIFNKIDLVSQEELRAWETKINSWGYKPLFCSASRNSGLSSLVDILANKTSVIIGPSGVGKSSVINALGDVVGVNTWTRYKDGDIDSSDIEVVPNCNEEFEEQMVGEVSERSGRGKHTTRNVSLLKLPSGGYLADTPGFNQPNLGKVTSKLLPQLFPEIRSKTSERQCAFSDCMHVDEPNCVVGGDWERYAHYLQLLDELQKREEVELRTFGTKRESEMRYKVKASGIKQAEPRLVTKTHRRTSRHQKKQDLALELAEVENLLGNKKSNKSNN